MAEQGRPRAFPSPEGRTGTVEPPRPDQTVGRQQDISGPPTSFPVAKGSFRFDRSPSLRSIVERFSRQDVPVTALVDAMMELHGDSYLASWTWSAPAWPSDSLIQSTERWMEELEALLLGPQVFGRIAILGWCLLDDRVAAAAHASGIMAGIAQSIKPGLRDLLTPEAMHVLRRRAPLVALTVGELPPTLEVPGGEGAGAITCLALDSPTTGPVRSIGPWAAASGGQVFVGNGARSRPAFPEEATAPVRAMGFSRTHRLHVVTTLGALQVDPTSLALRSYENWPLTEAATVRPLGIIATPATDRGDVVWTTTNGGEPVPLPGEFPPSSALVATADYRVAAFSEGELFLAEVNRAGTSWAKARHFNGDATVLAATSDFLLLGDGAGRVQYISWDVEPGEPGVPSSLQALAGPVRFAVAGRQLAVVASEHELAVLSGGRLLSRYAPALDSGEEIRAVGLSDDGGTLAVSIFPLGLRFWRIDAVPEVRLSSYTADTPEGEDLLDVRPTADALAAILVARAVEPPLAIGLFGAWGSGKTFFMRQLEKRVAQLSGEAHNSRRAQDSLWAWRNIRQVSFNAWHYAAADVWAGLLEQLVRELARPAARGNLKLELPSELSALEQRRVQELAGAVDRLQEAKDELGEATEKLKAAERAAAAKEEELRNARAEVERIRTSAWRELVTQGALDSLDDALEVAGLPEVGTSLDQTLKEIDQARASLQSAGGLVRSAGSRRLVVGLAVALLAGVVAATVLQWFDVDLAGAFGLIAAVLGAIGATARWITAAAVNVESRLRQYDEAEGAARTAEAEVAGQLAQAQARVDQARVEVATRADGRDEAETRLREAQQRADSTTPGDLLMEYLEGRDTTNDYRGLLGLIGTVRRDLDVIAQAIARNNDDAAEQPHRPPDDVVNRVVLYIDDLDRCRPEVVVKVLEAVSMLLTFPMFVVVVAVDLHWISKSLATVYPELLTGGDVTPDNYLEKIFQVPVWLDRPSDEAAAAMAHALLAGSDPLPGDAGSAGQRSPQGRIPAPTGAPPTTAGTGRKGHQEPADRPTVALSTSPPAAIVLEPGEITAIEELAPLVARSPRALKRYLNTYRVLKALVPSDDLASARLLLAVATGRPDLGERLLTDIAEAKEGSLGDLVQAWPEADRAWLQASVPASLRTWSGWNCSELQLVAKEVRRFVFHTGDRTSVLVTG